MRALVYDGTLALQDLPRPSLTGDQVLLKTRLAGICNTDLELVAGYMAFQGVLGHEFVSEVVEGAPEWVGRRVVGEINVAEGDCDFCRRGIPSQCRNRTTVGLFQHQGAFADYMPLTVRNLYAVPDNVPDEAAVFTEPLAAALQILEAVHVSPRDRIVLIGAGKLGLLCAQVLRLTGADLSVVVRREKQAQLLAKWGIRAVSREEVSSSRAQVVVDCTGTAEGFAEALDMVEARGTIVLKSTYHGLPQVNLTRVAVDEVRVIGSRCGSFAAALRLMSMGVVDVEPLIEARYSVEDSLQAMQQAAERGALKILLEF